MARYSNFNFNLINKVNLSHMLIFSVDIPRRLVFYPNGDKKSNASGHISLYLAIDDANNHRDNNWSVYVNFKFFVQDQNENKYLPIEGKKFCFL